jgi:hypothetical protein
VRVVCITLNITTYCTLLPQAVRTLPFGPGEDCVFVANDWHASLLPVLLKDVYQPKGEFKNTKVGRARPQACMDGVAALPACTTCRLPACLVTELMNELLPARVPA